jgi:hypothetical protein
MFVNFVFSLLVAKPSCCVHMRVTSSSTTSCKATSKIEILRLRTPFLSGCHLGSFFHILLAGIIIECDISEERLFLPPFCFFTPACFVGVGSNRRRTD